MIQHLDMLSLDSPANVYMRYFGVTISDDPVGRIISDIKQDVRTLFVRFHKAACEHLHAQGRDVVWKLYDWPSRSIFVRSRPTIYQVGVDKECTIYTYRADYNLQAIERGLIGVTRPFNLNSAAGGSRHIPANVLSVPRLSPATADDNVSETAIHRVLLRHVDDHARSCRTLPEDLEVSQMSHEAMVSVKRQVTAISFSHGRIPTLQISSDVTLEEIESRSADIEYTGYLASPGPALACQSRLRALGFSGTAIRESYEAKRIHKLVGSFTDIYPVSSKHPWLWHEILMLVRLIAIVRPTIIRSEGAESVQLLLGGICANIINPSLDHTEARQLAAFMRCVGAHPALDLIPLVNKTALDLKSEDLGPRNFLEWCGEVVVVQVGKDEESDWAIVIPNVSQCRQLPLTLMISTTLGR